MEMELLNAGKIVNTHGIRGEVKVLRISDFDDRFKPGNILYLEGPDKEVQQVTVTAHRVHKGFDLICFKEFGNINEVEKFKGSYLKIPKTMLEELPDNEFYYHEIIGCSVFLPNGEELGKVKEILSPGANDVWVIQRPHGKDQLIPYIEEVVKSVDPTRKRIEIEPMEGLLD
ncbi:ribosome maturation factor RimM [Aciduricibacillus chroicocephali]|uniref:Ribosome maturation factor RimM n=1 Tax=Aciduricibacillus chroicocephali TaxID=3054939 RepID=A0ABY9KXY7_9BACI|nr:ribosome maturation factor RimM [Bacillaceae bacterium 44XB]